MKYNTLLRDPERDLYRGMEKDLRAAAPDVFASKIPRANVQQAWMLKALCETGCAKPEQVLLCVGSYADTAYLAAKDIYKADVVGIDPAEGTGHLSDYFEAHQDKLATFDAVFATSVMEHVPDDKTFMTQAWAFVRLGGYLLLTVDFKPFAALGDKIRGANERFYSTKRIIELAASLQDAAFLDEPKWDGQPDFHHAGHWYAFAAIALKKVTK